ncbi:Short-chain dehydrogenase reductase 2a, partial [Cucurbita argyrosperma subsp. sororia]
MCVNVKGVALGINHATPIMIPRATGCIISTTSVAGVSGGMGPPPTQHPNMSLRTLPMNLAAMVYVSTAFRRLELP